VQGQEYHDWRTNQAKSQQDFIYNNNKNKQGIGVHPYNPSYTGGRGRKIML
jgi:hypothetical protein